jgi:hypothetical protein
MADVGIDPPRILDGRRLAASAWRLAGLRLGPSGAITVAAPAGRVPGLGLELGLAVAVLILVVAVRLMPGNGGPPGRFRARSGRTATVRVFAIKSLRESEPRLHSHLLTPGGLGVGRSGQGPRAGVACRPAVCPGTRGL